jgi:hypothetical protein
MRLIIQWLGAMFGHWQHWLSGGGFGGFVVIVILIVEKLHPKGWTMSKRWYVVMISAFFVLGASFMTWNDQQQQIVSLNGSVRDLNDKLNALTETQFTMEPLQGVIGTVPGGSQVTFVLRISNMGAASAIPEDSWVLSALTSDGVSHGAKMEMLKPGDTDLCLNHDGLLLGAKRFVPADALYEKASHPIGSGDYRVGVLQASFPGMTKDELLEDTTRLKLRVDDVRGKQFIWDISIADLRQKSGKFIFLPSITNVENVSTSTCPMAQNTK